MRNEIVNAIECITVFVVFKVYLVGTVGVDGKVAFVICINDDVVTVCVLCKVLLKSFCTCVLFIRLKTVVNALTDFCKAS